uniref:Uncharacterized protein n=1 Tax=Poecilia latipinna TaxID=48699 RepID=A0A3B3USC1_9TELE
MLTFLHWLNCGYWLIALREHKLKSSEPNHNSVSSCVVFVDCHLFFWHMLWILNMCSSVDGCSALNRTSRMFSHSSVFRGT